MGATNNAPEVARGLGFRSLLIITVSLLVLGVGVASALTVGVVLERSTRTALSGELLAGQRVLLEAWGHRRAELRSEGRVVAEEPHVKAVTAAEEVSRETIAGVASEIQKAIGTDLFILTDAGGRLLVDTADSTQSGVNLAANDVVRAALAEGDGSGVWISKRDIYQVQASRLDFGDTPFGVLVIGNLIGASFVNSLESQIGACAVVELDGQPTAISQGCDDLDPAQVARALASVQSGDASQEIEISNVRYVAIGKPLPGYTGEHKLRCLLLRSLDDALAPARRVNRILSIIAAASLLFAFAGVGVLSRSLSRPLEALAELTKAYGAGAFSRRAAPEGPRETRALASSLNEMASEIEASREASRARDRLERELEIARRIQLSILPRDPRIPGLEVAARMQTASEVGGDYYDVLPAETGAWVGIGDVTGHGLNAGLIMLMLQSGVMSLTRALSDAAPSRLTELINGVIYHNVTDRLGEADFVTFSLFRYTSDGTFRFAGAHEEIIIYRAREKRCELVATEGLWLGMKADITQETVDQELHLEPGDLMVLYTDGITEAMSAKNEMFGLTRLVDCVTRLAQEPVDAVCDRILAEVADYAPKQDDDRTLLAMRRTV